MVGSPKTSQRYLAGCGPLLPHQAKNPLPLFKKGHRIVLLLTTPRHGWLPQDWPEEPPLYLTGCGAPAPAVLVVELQPQAKMPPPDPQSTTWITSYRNQLHSYLMKIRFIPNRIITKDNAGTLCNNCPYLIFAVPIFSLLTEISRRRLILQLLRQQAVNMLIITIAELLKNPLFEMVSTFAGTGSVFNCWQI